MRARRLVSVFVSVVSLACSAVTVAAGADSPPGTGTLLVGAASMSVLPTVDGTHDYLKTGFPARGNVNDPGILVPKWDDGRIAVGNGKPESYWVHDDIRATAIAIDDPRSAHIVVILASDLYMVFRSDGEAIRAKAAALLPEDIAPRVKVVVTASHNHHGPDTAFDVNHEWYDLMIDQGAAAIVEAIDELRPARLKVAQTEHYFGLRDSRDPQVFDPTLGVLEATATNGKTIATLIFWGNHPETTLGWNPPIAGIADECAQINLQPCTIEARQLRDGFRGSW